jgi:hypothetical protein
MIYRQHNRLRAVFSNPILVVKLCENRHLTKNPAIKRDHRSARYYVFDAVFFD